MSKFNQTIQEVEKTQKPNIQTTQPQQSEEKPKKKKPSKTRIFFRWLYIFSIAFVLSALFTASYLFYEGYSLKDIHWQTPFREVIRLDQQESFLKAPVRSKTAPQIVLNAQPVANDPKD
jgi:hypothetical protein